MPRTIAAVAVLLSAMLVGCAGGPPLSWSNPGTVQQQRLRATIFDPWPDSQLGPEVLGGRPRDYSEPLPQPVKNRLYVDSLWGR
jgi:hypothetical protein